MTTTRDRLTQLRVNWEGMEAGLMPILVEGDSPATVEIKEMAIPDLISALADEELFAAAHVILTQLAGIEHQTFPAWNGLAVKIGANGITTVDPEQRFELTRRWVRWHDTIPHPKTLFPNEHS
jgi:hypothetical protein